MFVCNNGLGLLIEHRNEFCAISFVNWHKIWQIVWQGSTLHILFTEQKLITNNRSQLVILIHLFKFKQVFNLLIISGWPGGNFVLP